MLLKNQILESVSPTWLGSLAHLWPEGGRENLIRSPQEDRMQWERRFPKGILVTMTMEGEQAKITRHLVK